jgi:hypothetical protein
LSVTDDQQIVMLAHELQHAVEIADAAHVVDQRSMLLHDMCIGIEVSHGTARIHAFETASPGQRRSWSAMSFPDGVAPYLD